MHSGNGCVLKTKLIIIFHVDVIRTYIFLLLNQNACERKKWVALRARAPQSVAYILHVIRAYDIEVFWMKLSYRRLSNRVNESRVTLINFIASQIHNEIIIFFTSSATFETDDQFRFFASFFRTKSKKFGWLPFYFNLLHLNVRRFVSYPNRFWQM